MNYAFVVTTYVYKDIWRSTIGEHLICEREMLNSTNRYAIAVLKDDVIIGHLPRVLSQICSLFILGELSPVLYMEYKDIQWIFLKRD